MATTAFQIGDISHVPSGFVIRHNKPGRIWTARKNGLHLGQRFIHLGLSRKTIHEVFKDVIAGDLIDNGATL